jgi:hypothetical protein
MAYRLLVGVVVGLHFAFLALVVFGGFLAWRWPRALWVHVAAVAWAVVIVTAPGLLCPLTVAENWARRRAGMASYTGGFIDRYIQGVVYPSRYTPWVQAAVAIVVIASWVGLYRRRRRVGTTPPPGERSDATPVSADPRP